MDIPLELLKDLKKKEKDLQAREAKLKREKELKRRKQRHNVNVEKVSKKVNVESFNVQYQQ